jgi:hypothetical protein
MLRYSLAVLAGLIAISTVSAASWADAMFTELSKDFGSVPRGPLLTHPFRVVNNTKGVVSISGIRVSCGCTTATALKGQLQPGEETTILAQMDTRRFSNVKTVTIFIQFDKPAWEEVRLWVQANSRDDVIVAPDTLSFGTIKRGTGPASSVTISFIGNPQSQITDVVSDSNYVKLAVKEVLRQDTEVRYELTATVREDVPVGKWYTDVWVKTNNPMIPKVRVPLTVEIQSALSVSPPTLQLGQAKVGQEAERKIILRGVRPFKISSVIGSDGQITAVPGGQEKKPVHVLTVRLKGTQAGEINNTFKVITDMPEEGEIEFKAHGEVVP